jgi:mannose-6-phosphate isomerase-like protein (cupin superfamily)
MASIINIESESAQVGPRGEVEHVRTSGYSLNFWNLRGLEKAPSHSNSYDIAIYVVSGVLHVYDEKNIDRIIAAGDSVLIPADTEYSMSAEKADVVEYRTRIL